MESTLTPSSGTLDAATYFFVNSSAFILVVAVPFFFLGLWMGRLTWGRYRRRYSESEDAVENLKVEVAQLKRRIAEQSARPIATFAHQQAAAPSLASTPMRATVFPEGNMFCLWAEPDWVPPAIKPQPSHPGKPFSLWTDPDFRPRLGFQTGKAFTLWTSDEWEPVFTPKAALPAAKPFTLWTESGWQAPQRVHPWSTAFTLWTAPDWVPAVPKPSPTPCSQSFSIWTEPGWEPLKRKHPWSCAFSLWTLPDWQPSFAQPHPLHRSAAFSVFTEDDWVAPKRVHPWSRAFTMWTEDGWEPTVSRSAPTPPSEAFAVWTAPDWVQPALPPRPAPAPSRDTTSIPGATPSVATIFAKAKSATSRIPLMPSEASGKGSSTQRLTPSREMIAAVAASVRPLTPATLAASVAEAPVIPAPVQAQAEDPVVEAMPASSRPAPHPVAPKPTAPRPHPPAQRAPAPAAPVKSGLFAKFVAVAKGALGIRPEPPRSAPPPPHAPALNPEPEFEPEPAPALTAACDPVVEEAAPAAPVIRQPILSGETSRVRLPKSQAFTVWTQPAWVPPTSKTSPIPRPDQLDPPEPPREPKRQTLPLNMTGAVPVAVTPKQEVSAVPAPSPTTTAVPLPAPGLFESIPVSPEVPASPSHPKAPAVEESSKASRPPLYEEMVSKLKGITPPEAKTPPSATRASAGGLPSGTVAYMGDILTGRVRNDFLLGIVYKNPPPLRDDLTELKGIAAVLQTRLNDMGVFTFKQIALWTQDQAAEFSARLGFKDRAEREHWMTQARELHEKKYGHPL